MDNLETPRVDVWRSGENGQKELDVRTALCLLELHDSGADSPQNQYQTDIKTACTTARLHDGFGLLWTHNLLSDVVDA
jgi:hypothetical protein